MSKLQYFDYEGFGERSKRDVNYSQAVRIGNRIEISGQGGWNRITEEIPTNLATEVDRAFDNVEHALKQAGGTGWDQVYKTVMYSTVEVAEVMEHAVRNLKKRCQNHGPLLTGLQVKGLYGTMKVEIEVVAVVE